MTDITAILAKPEDYGFTFLTETVKRDKRTSGPVPLIKVINVPLFEKHFPGVILETEDGQSNQTSLKTRLVRWLLKIEQPQMKFGPGPRGEFYATAEELTAAWRNEVNAVQTKVGQRK